MEMETKENGDIQEDWSAPPSPIDMLQHLSEEAVRVAGVAWHNACSVSPLMNSTPILEPAPTHRRTRSDLVAPGFKHSNSTSNFHKWRCTMQKALKWGSHSFREERQYSFDPEILANQKRQWYQLHWKTLDPEKYKEPTSLFEHFVVVGLRPDANLEVVEDAFVRRKIWEKEIGRSEVSATNMQQPTIPTLEPQVLFKYPRGKKLALRLKDLAAFCFPGGVKARMLERTPSFSELNELVYGQEHLSRDDLAFIFSLKVADSATVYGVCLHVQEIVQKPPIVSGFSSPISLSNSGRNRFLVSAPRCYCILTRVPFFELHYEMLNSIIAQERLNRITQFVNEMSLADYVPSPTLSKNGTADSPGGQSVTDWMASAIPVDSAMALTAAAAGIISDEELPSSRWDFYCPGSATPSDASDYSLFRELDKDGSKNLQVFDDCNSETSELRYNGHTPDNNPCVSQRDQSAEDSPYAESSFSSARSMASEEDDDEMFYNCNKDPWDNLMEWAKENKNDLLQIICGYHSIPIPARGCEIVFQPLEHLQAIEYQRPPLSSTGPCEKYFELIRQNSREASEVKLKLAAAEEAASLSLWSTATICRVLSLESILALVAGVLLEKQVVVLCPNLGVLSAIVLSIIPLIRPFEWQSLFLPILPGRMMEFLEAPVPYIVGIQQEATDSKMKTSNLVQVNVVKDQVKSCSIPVLPRRKELISNLRPFHSTLSCQNSIAQRHPVYKCSEVQAEAAAQFLTVMRQYLDSLCSDLRSHTITSVESNNDRVSILLKDTFIDSFPVRDQSFIKLFVETQLFSVLSDFRLANYENEYG